MNLPQVVWSRRSLLKPGQTTDQDGYGPMEFGFSTGQREVAQVRNDNRDSSYWTDIPMQASKWSILVTVEVWHDREGNVWIYAWPNPKNLEGGQE